jgi:hypothetical protein
MSRISVKSVGLTLFTVVCAVVAAYFGQPLIHGNDTAVNVIVTVYSILAGFLVAIIAIIGEPSLTPPGSWRIAEGNREKTIQRLTRHKYLFYIYLVSLSLVFAATLLKDKCPCVTPWIERAYLFFSVLAFGLSLSLPGALMRMQQERVDYLIESRRSRRKAEKD